MGFKITQILIGISITLVVMVLTYTALFYLGEQLIKPEGKDGSPYDPCADTHYCPSGWCGSAGCSYVCCDDEEFYARYYKGFWYLPFSLGNIIGILLMLIPLGAFFIYLIFGKHAK